MLAPELGERAHHVVIAAKVLVPGRRSHTCRVKHVATAALRAEMAERRIAAIDARIADLTAARESLSRLAKRCGSGSAGPCPILTAFEQPAG